MGSESTNVKSFYKDQNIYKEGQAGTTAFLIQKGSVNLFKTQGNKREKFAHLGKGEIFGEMGALAGLPRTETAEAAEYCDVVVISKQLISNLLGQSPKTVKHLVSLLVKKVQAADRRAASGGGTHKNSFLSICRLLEIAYRNHLQTPPQEARKDPNHSLGLKRSDFTKVCKEVLLVTQLDIDLVLEKLGNLNILSIDNRKLDKAFAERFIKISDTANFLQVATNLQKELNDAGLDETELEYIDLFDFAEAVGTNPEIIYKKIAQGELPESLFFFDGKNIRQWAKTKGKEFFQKVTRKKKNIEELEDVNDIVFVDKATLQEAFSSLGYYKIGILLSVAGEEAKNKIVGALSKKIASIVQEEAKGREHVDETEAEDIQDELISMIKTIKGVPA
ncbi:MAG: cyclic nucleotide-binding domain-containing protein [Proteobacteria bacterium]|nr:cyclic nucleotide-binding domain-containing protein [Pseudomonadota bacterium]MBU1611163.1 cyclic nucleotide-binding domain-containing protein [Pseudomonadota bacterium]